LRASTSPWTLCIAPRGCCSGPQRSIATSPSPSVRWTGFLRSPSERGANCRGRMRRSLCFCAESGAYAGDRRRPKPLRQEGERAGRWRSRWRQRAAPRRARRSARGRSQARGSRATYSKLTNADRCQPLSTLSTSLGTPTPRWLVLERRGQGQGPRGRTEGLMVEGKAIPLDCDSLHVRRAQAGTRGPFVAPRQASSPDLRGTPKSEARQWSSRQVCPGEAASDIGFQCT
jgi:hypothetical protein